MDRIEVTKQLVKDGKISQEIAEIIFPELKESEDERIRKLLIGVVELYYGNTDEQEKKDCLAWLEKQGEKKNIQTINEVWKDMRLEVGAQASGNRHEPLYSDNSTKLFSLNDIDEIIEKISEKQGSQNLANSEKTCKVEPKFMVGDWVTDGKEIGQIIEWNHPDCIGYKTNHGTEKAFYKEDTSKWHRWTIQDAKDGDVLASGNIIIIYKLGSDSEDIIYSYCYLNNDGKFTNEIEDWFSDKFHPATKEQRETLFKAMHEASYEWDVEKKELKMIEQNPAWNQEDEIGFRDAMWAIEQVRTIAKDENDMGNLWYAEKWLKALKQRVLPQPKQEWSEEDKENLDRIISIIHCYTGTVQEENKLIEWLKERYTWKPSDEQIDTLQDAIVYVEGCNYFKDRRSVLENLYSDLKKLKG